MNKLRIAFFKAEHGELDDKIIDFFNGNIGYSHCEVVVNRNHMIGSHFKAGGVKDFYYVDIFSNPKWDILELDIPREMAVKVAESFLDHPYDTLGVVLFYMGLKFGDSERGVWCSELCAECVNAQLESLNKDPLCEDPRVMPNDLYLHMKEFGATEYNLSNQVDASRKRNSILVQPQDVYDRITKEDYLKMRGMR